MVERPCRGPQQAAPLHRASPAAVRFAHRPVAAAAPLPPLTAVGSAGGWGGGRGLGGAEGTGVMGLYVATADCLCVLCVLFCSAVWRRRRRGWVGRGGVLVRLDT